MDFSYTVEEKKFVDEVKDFLANNPPAKFAIDCPEPGDSLGAFSREFYKKLGEAGYLSLGWPRDYGGRQASIMKQFILLEQLGYNEAPFAAAHLIETVPRLLLSDGTERAKAELLPKINTGDIIFWLGYSEPQAGSDLLNLETTADQEGDYFILNGHKIWSTWAQHSDWVYLLTRTDLEVPRARGLSLFLVDKKLPGLTVKPIFNLTGTAVHCEVFFDNVRVHKDYLIGKKNQGLNLMLAGLESDRFWGRAPKPMWLKRFFEDFVHFIHHESIGKDIASLNPGIGKALAKFSAEIKVARLFAYRCAKMLNDGIPLNYESSVLKYYADELQFRFFNFIADNAGILGTLRESKTLPFARKLFERSIWSIPISVAGGTTEIQKETIARLKFGLMRTSIKKKSRS